MAEAILTAEHLTKTYFRESRDAGRTFNAVSDASLALAPGELVELAGRSGGGKSTLLNMLAGLLTPSSGTVRYAGQDLYALTDAELSRTRNEAFGVIPQASAPIPTLTVIENVKLPHTLYRPDTSDPDARAMELLERLGIAELSETMPSALSGGELRRMAIARALVNEPKVLFADEPTADLDDENTAIVLQTLRSAADAGTAVLLVTHEQAAAAYATRCLRMDAGKLVE